MSTCLIPTTATSIVNREKKSVKFLSRSCLPLAGPDPILISRSRSCFLDTIDHVGQDGSGMHELSPSGEWSAQMLLGCVSPVRFCEPTASSWKKIENWIRHGTKSEPTNVVTGCPT